MEMETEQGGEGLELAEKEVCCDMYCDLFGGASPGVKGPVSRPASQPVSGGGGKKDERLGGWKRSAQQSRRWLAAVTFAAVC